MVRVRVVTPVPLHSSQGCSMIEPLPRQSVHGSEKPNAPWLRLITPEPLQVGHTFGLVPGRAPLPWQLVHGAGLVSRSGIATPLAASTKSSSVSVSRSLPRRGRLGRALRAASEQAAEQVADVGAAGLAGGVEQIVEVELGAVATAEAAEATAVEPAAAEAAAGEQPSGFVVLLALGRIRQARCGLGDRLEPFTRRRGCRDSRPDADRAPACGRRA